MLIELVEFGRKLDEKMKAMLREKKENVQGTSSDGKENGTQKGHSWNNTSWLPCRSGSTTWLSIKIICGALPPQILSDSFGGVSFRHWYF